MLFKFTVNDDIVAAKEDKVQLKKDIVYIANEFWTERIPISKKAIKIEDDKTYNINTDVNDKKLLFIMSSGMGDVLFLTPLINFVKKKYPKVSIGFATAKPNQDILSIINNIDEIIDYPIEETNYDKYDYIFKVEEIAKNTEENIYELYFKEIGVTEITPEMCRPSIKASLLNNIEVDDNLIGIHPFATDGIRNLNFDLVLNLCLKLNYNIVLFSNKEEMIQNQHRFTGSKIRWAINSINNIQSTVRLMAKCKIIFATDSVITHLAQAIEKQCISIYGPFHKESRVKHYKNITVIDNHPECRCSLHQYGKCPKGYQNSPCLIFDPDLIINIIEGNEIKNDPVLLDTVVTKYNLEANDVEEEKEETN